jgi:putative PIN family toxin of toxin-antitoxin system
MTDRLRVVLDTQVWIDIYLRLAIINPAQPYAAIFDAFIDDEFVPIYSRPTFDELKYQLTRGRQVAQYYRIDPLHANEFIESIFYEVGEFVEITGELRVSSDPKDNMFVETAVVAKADYLVREDRDLREPAVHAMLRKHNIRGVFPKQLRQILSERRRLEETTS